MAKTITVEYTNPVTGAQATKVISIDVERYRKDTELGAVENFFLKATGSGESDDLINIDDLISDILDGRPSHAKKGFFESLVSAAFTAMGSTLFLRGNPTEIGFEASVPCVVMDKFGRVKDWFVPSAVGSTFLTIPTSGAAALEVDCKIDWIVQQAKYALSSMGENSMLGQKAQSEQPNKPTVVTGTGSVGAGINASWTKPTDVVLKYFDVYCYKQSIVPTVIEPNARPSVEDRDASLSSSVVNLTQYFDESDMQLHALVAGDYFLGIVAKDGIGARDVNESEIGWSAKITIT